ncbi:MAG: PD-(D/E)XK nuclease family protein, partial [Christensenella sp.]|uniref:PD-(D/E)XK nuclease family protein n=1 Tax=Christensenella sp. TaxID=1935934 RepID=UPI002B20604B
MQFSHSRVDLFTQCKYRYKLRYIDKLKTLPDDNPSNALFLGTALHTGLEKGVDAAIAEYYGNYPIITDAHINEAIKLAEMIPRTKALLPPGGVFEQSIMTSDFIGYMDYLVQVDEVKVRRRMVPVYDLYDFKYSNSDDRYKESGQLTEYKHFYESQTGRKIRNLYYVMV